MISFSSSRPTAALHWRPSSVNLTAAASRFLPSAPADPRPSTVVIEKEIEPCPNAFFVFLSSLFPSHLRQKKTILTLFNFFKTGRLTMAPQSGGPTTRTKTRQNVSYITLWSDVIIGQQAEAKAAAAAAAVRWGCLEKRRHVLWSQSTGSGSCSSNTPPPWRLCWDDNFSFSRCRASILPVTVFNCTAAAPRPDYSARRAWKTRRGNGGADRNV